MTRVAINGFGRIGRLALRAAWDWPDIDIVLINEIGGPIESAAHLLEFDSVQGRWTHEVHVHDSDLVIAGRKVAYRSHDAIGDIAWDEFDVDVVVECTGVFRTLQRLQPYADADIANVVVSAPVKENVPNIVLGVNEHIYDATRHNIVSAASCTTNCIAPVIKVLNDRFGISHGSFTTIHDITNTQNVLDGFHKDLRRARSSGTSLIPTTTGSASAIGDVFPELKGKLAGVAVRVPVTNASLSDCVFELETSTDVGMVNKVLHDAAIGELQGILGFEDRPLVSVDYCGDTRSGIVDGLSTTMVGDKHVKLLVWYDNEVGYANRLMELVRLVSA